MADKIYIIGCGGHARSVADVILDNDFAAQILFVDEQARDDEKILGFPVIKYLPDNAEKVFVAIGDNAKRCSVSQNRKLIKVISKRAYVSNSAELADGVFVGDGAHIGPEAHIGRGAIINTNAVVEHEAQVDDFTHISVNTAVCGRSKIGEKVFIGAGATVIDKVSISSDVIIGANAVVVKDIQKTGIYTGVPAKRKEK